jgi:hypothetical protein
MPTVPTHHVVSLESLYELHKEWDELVAYREAVRSQPYDPDAEAQLVWRLERHQQRLTSIKQTILRQSLADAEGSSSIEDPPVFSN